MFVFLYVALVVIVNLMGIEGDVISAFNETFGADFTGLGVYFAGLAFSFLVEGVRS